MAPLYEYTSWARAGPTRRALGTSHIWSLIASYSGVLGARRLMGACREARVGAWVWLKTQPGLVVCNGRSCNITRHVIRCYT